MGRDDQHPRGADEADHIIGDALGGSGDFRSGNIIPLSRHLNRGAYNAWENYGVKPLVKTSKRVCVIVTLEYNETIQKKYDDKPTRPTYLHYHVWADGKHHYKGFSND